LLGNFNLYLSISGKPILEVNIIQTFRIWTWFSYYLLGGLLGKSELREWIINKINPRINLVLVVVISIVIVWYQHNVGSHLYHQVLKAEYFYVNILTFVWVVSISISVMRLKISENPIINLLSKNIMGIYILHPTIITGFKKVLHGSSNSLQIFMFIILIFVCSLVLSVFMQKIPIIKRVVSI